MQKKRFAKFLLFSIGLLFIYFSIRWVNSPTKGTFNVLGESSDRIQNKETESNEVTNKIFGIKYSDNYVIKVQETSDTQNLELLVLSKSKAGSTKLVISSNQTVELNLLDIPSVKYRNSNAELYLEKPTKLKDISGLQYERQDGSYEKTAFFLKDGVVTSISLTSPLVNSELDEDYEYILDNFSWR